jgi:thiol-disulfide isomerase/thioredoxin
VFRIWVAIGAALALIGASQEPLPLETLSGAPAELAPASADQTLVVHFWASWCPSCVEELAFLTAEAEACAPDRVRFVTVNVGDSSDEIRAYLERNGIGLETLSDPHGRVWRRLSGVGLPINLIWSEAARRVEVGPRSETEWSALLGRLGCRDTNGDP